MFAIPTPRAVFHRLGFAHLYHLTRLAALGRIVSRVTGHPGDWTDCDIALTSASGWHPSMAYLARDYSVIDLELKLRDRGVYTYFFGGPPSAWGLRKNLGLDPERPVQDQGYAIIRIATAALLARYDGPIFCRPDDRAVVIRGNYAGPAQVQPAPIGLGGA